MAHELGHVRNRDTLIMTMVATIAGAISMLANFGLFFRGHDGRGAGMAGLLAVLVAPFAAMIVQMAISRTREYGADRAGGEISGNPRALASALRKIAGGARSEEHTAELQSLMRLSYARFCFKTKNIQQSYQNDHHTKRYQ